MAVEFIDEMYDVSFGDSRIYNSLKKPQAKAYCWITSKNVTFFQFRCRRIYLKNTIMAGVTVRQVLFMLVTWELKKAKLCRKTRMDLSFCRCLHIKLGKFKRFLISSFYA